MFEYLRVTVTWQGFGKCKIEIRFHGPCPSGYRDNTLRASSRNCVAAHPISTIYAPQCPSCLQTILNGLTWYLFANMRM